MIWYGDTYRTRLETQDGKVLIVSNEEEVMNAFKAHFYFRPDLEVRKENISINWSSESINVELHFSDGTLNQRYVLVPLLIP
jgi:hypothetical protein